MNAHCFQLKVDYKSVLDSYCVDSYVINVKRYRGKYDHNVHAIKGNTHIDFQIHVFEKNGKMVVYEWDSVEGIPKYKAVSDDIGEMIENGEMNRLTIDGYVHLHCFFNKTM